ncbi:MAG: ATP-binding protein, partial [Candidatus Omnitrophica bacterium]|nr:ATP-binding protein [Candidatus Omnitrophota bacterium]
MGVKTIIDEQISSRLDLVPPFIAATVQKLTILNLNDETVFDIKLCLHEAVVNAVKHGNKEKNDLSVHVVVKADNREVTLEVTDQGDGFDFSQIPNPTSEDNIGKFHGRGVYLIQNYMDSVEFLNGGRTIR